MIVDLVLYILLYLPPQYLPVYISAWDTKMACEEEAKVVAKKMQEHPGTVYCMEETIKVFKEVRR